MKKKNMFIFLSPHLKNIFVESLSTDEDGLNENIEEQTVKEEDILK